jgi:hypothetical protein
LQPLLPSYLPGSLALPPPPSTSGTPPASHFSAGWDHLASQVRRSAQPSHWPCREDYLSPKVRLLSLTSPPPPPPPPPIPVYIPRSKKQANSHRDQRGPCSAPGRVASLGEACRWARWEVLGT